MLNQRFWIGLDHSSNQCFLDFRIHFCVSLRNDVKRQRTISVLDRRGQRRNVQNLLDDSSSLFDIALAGNSLVNDCCRNVVAHCHFRGGNQAIASNAIEDRIPLVSSAHEKDGSHLGVGWSTNGMGWTQIKFVLATNAPLFGRYLSRGRLGVDTVASSLLRHVVVVVVVWIVNSLTANDTAEVLVRISAKVHEQRAKPQIYGRNHGKGSSTLRNTAFRLRLFHDIEREAK